MGKNETARINNCPFRNKQNIKKQQKRVENEKLKVLILCKS
jgi:hypothetical protein